MPNINDVAREAHVSPITVSRVINGSDAVSPPTRERVLAAVRKLGYQPNLLARGLTMDALHTLGVLITRVENPMYSLMIAGINAEAASANYDILLAGSNDLNGSIKSVHTLMNKRVDGLIVLPIEYRGDAMQTDEDFAHMVAFVRRFEGILAQRGDSRLRVVTVGTQIERGVDGRVIENYTGGAVMAVDHLVAMGHADIGFLSNRITDRGIWGERYRGFFGGMAAHGLPVRPEAVAYCDESVESAREAMARLLAGGRLPSALYCANDLIAVGAIQAAQRAGLRVPEDLSVIGHDGSVYGEVTLPPLTTVAIDPMGIGRRAVRLLLDALSGDAAGDVVISPSIVERGSVRRMSSAS